MTNDEAHWKRKFEQLMLLRLFGLAIFLLGMALSFSDVVRPGGWPQGGAVLIIAGALTTALAPRIMKRVWTRR